MAAGRVSRAGSLEPRDSVLRLCFCWVRKAGAYGRCAWWVRCLSVLCFGGGGSRCRSLFFYACVVSSRLECVWSLSLLSVARFAVAFDGDGGVRGDWQRCREERG